MPLALVKNKICYYFISFDEKKNYSFFEFNLFNFVIKKALSGLIFIKNIAIYCLCFHNLQELLKCISLLHLSSFQRFWSQHQIHRLILIKDIQDCFYNIKYIKGCTVILTFRNFTPSANLGRLHLYVSLYQFQNVLLNYNSVK